MYVSATLKLTVNTWKTSTQTAAQIHK